MHRPASWLLAAGLAAAAVGCGDDPPSPNPGAGTPGSPLSKGSTPTTADQVVSNKGVLFTKNNTMPFTGTLVDSWNAKNGGKKKYECAYIEGLKHGVEMRWHPNGKRSLRTEYTEGKQHGARMEWHLNGAKKSHTQFVQGNPEGNARGWHDNAKPAFHGSYTNGLAAGVVQSWWKNGNRATYQNHVDGKPIGPKVKWYPNGRTNSITLYQDGLQNGSSITWHANGKKKMELQFVKGQAHGLVSEWYDSGGRMSVSKYEKGQMHGGGEGYYPDGKLLWQGKWNLGQPVNVHVTLFPNGKPKLRVEYENGVMTKKFRFNEAGQVVDSQIIPPGRIRMQILDDLKFQLEGKKAEDLQKFFGKPNRVEGNVWIYTGLKIQSTDEKFRSVLRVSFNGGFIALINAADK